MDGYGNGDLSKEDQRRSVEEESARGQREDKAGMGRSTLWDWKTKTWDLIQRSQRRLGSRQDQERSSRSEDTARLSRWDDHCTNMGRVNRTTKYQSSPNQEEKSLDDIRDHSKKFGRSRMQIGRAD
ncbi:unnamed protein product [Microthlaspi erraticum]|uniref:Uncharacterized protein n=1 Tax=Microthlaspi erraticum TaxID=1685480 RepID=A0A6D2HWX0_9BRAS|nr:unnamed protein product [Microthlaspi erraticum]